MVSDLARSWEPTAVVAAIQMFTVGTNRSCGSNSNVHRGNQQQLWQQFKCSPWEPTAVVAAIQMFTVGTNRSCGGNSNVHCGNQQQLWQQI